MSYTSRVIRMHQVLERAIQKKLRSVDQEDEVVQWESGLRKAALAALEQHARSRPAIDALLKSVDRLEKDPAAPNLTDLLAQLLAALEEAAPVQAKWPHALLCLVMARPRMTGKALVYAQKIDPLCLDGNERYLFMLMRWELLVHSGKLQQAHEELEGLNTDGIRSRIMAAVFEERRARILWSRNSQEALQAVDRGISALKLDRARSNKQEIRRFRASAQLHRTRAQMLLSLDRLREAQAAADLSIEFARAWTQRVPEDVTAQIVLARNLRLNGEILADASRVMASFRSYRESRKIIEELLQRMPAEPALQAELPARHDVMGDLYFAKLQLAQAFEEYQASIAHSAHLAMRDPDNVRWAVEQVTTTLKMARVLKHQCDYRSALDLLEIAWQEVQKLLRTDSQSLGFQALAIEVCEFAGSMEYSRHQHHTAKRWFEQAQQRLAQSVAADDDSARWQLMQLSVDVQSASNDLYLGEVVSAAEQLMRAKALILKMLGEGRVSARLLSYLATFYMLMSVQMLHHGQIQRAVRLMLSAHQTALQCVRQFAGAKPWQILLASAEMQLAQGLQLCGKTHQSVRLLDKAAQSLQTLSQTHLQDFELHSQWLQAWLQSLDMSQHDPAGNEAQLLALLHQIRSHLDSMPSHEGLGSGLLIMAMGKLVELYLSVRDLHKAKEMARQRLQLAIEMVKACPSVHFLEMQHVSVLAQTAQLSLGQGDPAQAVLHASEGLRLIEKYSQGEYRIAADAVPVGQLMLTLASAYERMGQAANLARIAPQAMRLTRWLYSTGTQHPVHRALMLALAKVGQSGVAASTRNSAAAKVLSPSR